jgi:hypothetical protein
MKRYLIPFFLIPLMPPHAVLAQDLTRSSKYSDELKNGASITLYAMRDCASCYYYLPTNLGITRNSDGTPEVSLVTWKNDENSKVVGGILHFLVSWGIGQEDERYISSRLRSKVDTSAVVMGPVSVQATLDYPKFRDDCDLTELLLAHVTAVPPAPTTPGAKMAFSFRFDEDAIARLMKYVDTPSKAVTKLVLVYTYMLVQENGLTIQNDVQLELRMADIFKLIK